MEGKDNQDDPACHTVQLIEGDFGKRWLQPLQLVGRTLDNKGPSLLFKGFQCSLKKSSHYDTSKQKQAYQ